MLAERIGVFQLRGLRLVYSEMQFQERFNLFVKGRLDASFHLLD